MAEPTEEVEQVRELARQFAAAELRPHAERWDREAALEPRVLTELAGLGFFGMLAPEAAGGLDFGLPAYTAALEALAWGEPAVAFVLATHGAFGVQLLRAHGTPAQRERWLGQLAAGELVACLALSEPGSGTEFAALRTTAAPDPDGWVITGRKTWVGGAPPAGLAIVAARTAAAAEAPEAGIGLFLVPLDAPGVTIEGRQETMGLRPLAFSTVALSAVRVGAEAALGDPGRGAELLGEGMLLARLGVAAQAVGIARAALEHAIAYADQREQFGRRLREFEGVQQMLADMATRAEAAGALMQGAAAAPTVRAVAMAKVFASEAAMRNATQAVQIYGGYGYMRHYPVEKLMRDAKATEIYELGNDLERVAIARELYREG